MLVNLLFRSKARYIGQDNREERDLAAELGASEEFSAPSIMSLLYSIWAALKQ